jgi:hypothetical protein
MIMINERDDFCMSSKESGPLLISNKRCPGFIEKNVKWEIVVISYGSRNKNGELSKLAVPRYRIFIR